jgi:hypothetical protein
MTEPPRKLIEIGTFGGSSADELFSANGDIVGVMLRDAIARADAARAAEEKARLSAAADAERVQARAAGTRRARAARRLRQALKLWRR